MEDPLAATPNTPGRTVEGPSIEPSATLVFQSAPPDAPAWVETCRSGVRAWAASRGFAYRFVGEEIFRGVPDWYLDKTRDRRQVATDLGRLLQARRFLAEEWRRVIWLDADVLVLDPARLTLAGLGPVGFGREQWVVADPKRPGRWGVRRNVHNALALFDRGNSLLDFYIDACLSIVGRHDGPPVPQIVGPKLLGALQSLAAFPVTDQVGAFSPPVLADLARGGGPALETLIGATGGLPPAANLAASLADARTAAQVTGRFAPPSGPAAPAKGGR